ncbi:RRP8 [Sanghuangporus sanghuang]
MALFEVPGWSMPSDVRPIADANLKKRKRSAPSEDSTSKLQTASVNLEKLMESLDRPESSPKGKDRKKKTRSDEKARRKNKRNETGQVPLERSVQESSPSLPSKQKNAVLKERGNEDSGVPSSVSHSEGNALHTAATTQAHSEQNRPEKTKKKKRRKNKESKFDQSPEEMRTSTDDGGAFSPLTSLQSKMKQSLDGARFRWINEMLYKLDSRDAERLINENPTIFDEYHLGFRRQVTSWPKNPVDHFIKTLSSYPERSVIVDLGCGDAALARNLVPKGYTVLSFDLCSANPFIVAADICGRLPLPGFEANDEGQVVDVVVCCLSLMNSNWLNCVRETGRILKKGGELKIAEVASRFTNVDRFTSVICSIGFRLVHRDERNSHFSLFDFERTEHSKDLEDKVWQKILTCGDALQPCEYKKR